MVLCDEACVAFVLALNEDLLLGFSKFFCINIGNTFVGNLNEPDSEKIGVS